MNSEIKTQSAVIDQKTSIFYYKDNEKIPYLNCEPLMISFTEN
jgi:hypothetical protein